MNVFPLSWQLPPGEKTGSFDWVVNTFDTESEMLGLVPLQREEPWETVDMLAAHFDAELILGVLPQILQLEQRLHAAMRSIGLPVLSLPPEQGRAIPILLHQLPIRGIILFHSKLQDVLDLVPDDYSTKLYYQVILGPHDKPPSALQENTYFEVHLVPSMVGLFQCPTLASERKNEFHMSSRFVWEIDGESIRVTDSGNSPRFTRALLPHRFSIREIPCQCGTPVRVTFL